MDEDHLCRCAVTNPPCWHCTDCRECFPLEEVNAQPRMGDIVRTEFHVIRDGIVASVDRGGDWIDVVCDDGIKRSFRLSNEFTTVTVLKRNDSHG